MSILLLNESGHTALTKYLMDINLYLAWGDLPPLLSTPAITDIDPDISSGSLLAGTYYYAVSACNDAGETLPSQVEEVELGATGKVNITWDSVAGAKTYKIYRGTSSTPSELRYIATIAITTFSDIGVNPPVPLSPKSQNNTSNAPWTAPIAPTDLSSVGLYRELGRRKITTKKYVLPDPDGIIETPQGNWTEVTFPTKYLYVNVEFDFEDGVGETMYQYGVYINTIVHSDYINYEYLTPAQLVNQGDLLAVANIFPINRQDSIREVAEIVFVL